MRWIGWAAWHVGECLMTFDNWWYNLTKRWPGWREADNAKHARREYFADNRMKAWPLYHLIARRKRG